MPSLSTMAAETEMQKSKTTLTALGLTIDTFVWPQGDYDQSLIALAQAGLPTAPLYKSARNTEFDLQRLWNFPIHAEDPRSPSKPRLSRRCKRGLRT